MLADYGEKIGLAFPPVDPVQQPKLIALLPDIATVSNPLDYTTPIWGRPDLTYPVFAKAISAISADVAVLIQDYPSAGLDASKSFYQQDAASFIKAAKEQGLPAAICATFPENMDAETRQTLIAEGVAPMQGIHETLNAIQDAADWWQARERIALAEPAPLLPILQTGESAMLTEDEGKRWLADNGFAVPVGQTVSLQQVGRTATEVGYPVVLKMMSPLLAHKTEAGAVALNLTDADAVASALIQMTADVTAHNPKAVTDKFLVEAMSPAPLAELIVTLRSDPQFGAALVLGSGGILVELVGDAVTLLLPATPDDIVRALNQLRAAPLLEGFRGRSKANTQKIATQLYQLCTAYLKDQTAIVEIEINPLFVYPDQICAVDALLHRAGDK